MADRSRGGVDGAIGEYARKPQQQVPEHRGDDAVAEPSRATFDGAARHRMFVERRRVVWRFPGQRGARRAQALSPQRAAYPVGEVERAAPRDHQGQGYRLDYPTVGHRRGDVADERAQRGRQPGNDHDHDRTPEFSVGGAAPFPVETPVEPFGGQPDHGGRRAKQLAQAGYSRQHGFAKQRDQNDCEGIVTVGHAAAHPETVRQWCATKAASID